METYLLIALVLTLPTMIFGGFGIVTFLEGKRERGNNIKTDGGHLTPLHSFWTWCYWKGVGMTEEEAEQEWQDYLHRLRY